MFSTKFGAIDTTFVPLNSNEMIKVEDGIAHFLEHKMFDMNGTDASDEFAKLGASTMPSLHQVEQPIYLVLLQMNIHVLSYY